MTPTHRDIVCISSIDWDFIWQGHQEIMSTLAAQGHRVLFVENTGVRAPRARDLPRLGQRIRNWWRGTKGFREERPGAVRLFAAAAAAAIFAHRSRGESIVTWPRLAPMDARDRILPPDRLDLSANAGRARSDSPTSIPR
jgi:hypothetical protein